MLPRTEIFITSSVFEDKFKIKLMQFFYEGLGGTGLVTTPLNMAPNLSECNVSHGGIAQLICSKQLNDLINCNQI